MNVLISVTQTLPLSGREVRLADAGGGRGDTWWALLGGYSITSIVSGAEMKAGPATKLEIPTGPGSEELSKATVLAKEPSSGELLGLRTGLAQPRPGAEVSGQWPTQ